MASRRTGNDFLKTPYDHTQVLDPLPTLQELNGSGKLRRGNDSGEERTWGDTRDGERQGTGKWWERLRGRESNLSDRRQQGDIANLSCLTLRNLPKSGHLVIYTVHSSNAVIGVQLHHMICLLFHYHLQVRSYAALSRAFFSYQQHPESWPWLGGLVRSLSICQRRPVSY